ncbi:MAG: hypothetical protein H7Y31_16720 [Chitinophagaceae bacterium]|nr:hypothetical protein [Chitinophagaceae bacterium]
MSAQLDDFIRNNRDEFDNDEPSAELWNKIDQRLGAGGRKSRLVSMNRTRWMAAASVIVLIGFATYFMINKTSTKADPVVAILPAVNDSIADKKLLNEINPAYAKEVYHFTQLIEIKQDELKQIAKEDPELYKEFVKDIDQLDSSYNLLKRELPANPNREQLLEAMIRNLQVQMDLLNQQLQVIQQIKQSKNKSDESNSKSI